jgi:FtsZ-binding cell division protein ZapB
METDSSEKVENVENIVMNSNSDVAENKSKTFNIPKISIYSILSGNIFETDICNKIIDIILFLFIISSFGFGFAAWFFIDNVTGVGYILCGVFSTVSLCSIKRMRLRATIQKSVNVLKEENQELKENNEELKENIDELEDNIDSLENTQKNLHEDLVLLKETIGIFGDNSDEIIENLKNIYKNLKNENEIHSKINENTIYLHILHIIKHYDRRCQFVLTSESLEKAKTTLLNAFPNLDFEELKGKITNNKIDAKMIVNSIKI